MSATVRISHSSWQILRQMAEEVGEPMQALLDRAIEAYRRQCLLQETNEAYTALRANAHAWLDEIAERKEWEATVGDDLGEEDCGKE